MQAERTEWTTLRATLESQLHAAQDLNTSLRTTLSQLRTTHSATESDLRAQLASAQQRASTASSSSSTDDWRTRYETLEQQYTQQQQLTDDVRREATQFLAEMRALSATSSAALEKEERLAATVAHLEAELQTWRARYTRAKAQVRTLRASSVGLLLLQGPDATATAAARAPEVVSEAGLVWDVHVTAFQLSIDELLQTARRVDAAAVLDGMKAVVRCVRDVTGDIDAGLGGARNSASTGTSSAGVATDSPRTSASSAALLGIDAGRVQGKLKARVSATANNLITAAKNHAGAAGLSPVSLLDAAASHLTMAVVELVKAVKVRVTPVEELEGGAEEEMEEEDGSLRPAPLGMGAWKGRSDSALQNGVGKGSRGSGLSSGYSEGSSPERERVSS